MNTFYRECLHCGYCCLRVQCSLSLRNYGLLSGYEKAYYSITLGTVVNKTSCPDLYSENGDYLCRQANIYCDKLAIGAGCSSNLNTMRMSKMKMRKKSAVKVYDNNGETIDCYTVVINGHVYTMSANPLSPQGVNQYCGEETKFKGATSGLLLSEIPDCLKDAIRMRLEVDEIC